MGWLQSLAAELAITMADGTVWLSIGQGLLVGGVCLLFGIWVARFVGLLPSDAPAGETLAVGLASGLLVLTAWWAAVASGGRSSFTPVAVGFALAFAVAVVQRRLPADASAIEVSSSRSARRRNLIAAFLGAALFLVAVALLYGSTMTLSPRDGVQPLEFMDEAYYSVLGADLANTGTESIYSPSGFSALEGLPVQTWYHWGEMWLASTVITIFGTTPIHARQLVALPILLLAATTMTGTLVRRVTRSASRGAFLFGFLACLFLAPVPLIAGPPLSSWARGLIFGITTYGVAAIAVLLSIYSLAVLSRRASTWALACFIGSAVALMVAAHLAIAMLALVGVGSVSTIRIVQSLMATRHLPLVAPTWRRTFVATGIAIVATVIWGLFTGHGVGTSLLSPSVLPFNASWREAVAITTVCSGTFLAIAVAWFLVRKERSIEAGLYLGTAILLVTGTIVWGARLGDFSMGHLFFGGIAVFATPVAAVAVWSIWLRLRATDHGRLAIAALVLAITQLEFGVAFGMGRLVDTGPGRYAPVPVAILAAIRNLPPGAKLAYACRPSEEVGFWDPRLMALDAHTGRRIVPMCFQAETFGQMIGGQTSADVPSPLFQWAPQRELYPDSGARPSPQDVAAFLKANGIDYIFVDAVHPNSLVPDAIPIATSSGPQVLRLP